MYTIETTQGIKTLFHPVKSAGTSIHTAIIKSSTDYNRYKVHVNQRHAGAQNLPEIYKHSPKYVVLRPPHEWYQSFYRFFLGVEGYLSFMLNDPRPDGYIYPIDINEFIRRSLNFKDTLTRYPNKARVFRNLLRSQSHMHFATGYFSSDFTPKDPDTMEQFDCTLYEWFHKPFGDDVFFIPMDRLDIVADLFEVEIPHINKTSDEKPHSDIEPEVMELIRKHHSLYYNMIEDFNPDQIKTIEEYREYKKYQKGKI